MEKKSKPSKGATKESSSERSSSKVPELAENMEHTLRRLVREKNRQRRESSVQYR